jgi:PAS domain S-box-containing protein
VLLDLARRDKANKVDAFRSITEAAAIALGVERVSIWHLAADASAIVCEDLFRQTEHCHDAGVMLMSRDHPRYFKALLESRTIRADDACVDLRTAEFAKSYLRPLGIMSMMDVPIWHRGTLYGVLCHEHTGSTRHWQDDEAEFAGNLADLAAGALEVSERYEVERRWTSLVESVSEAVYVLDLEFTISQMNAEGQRLLDRLGVGMRSEDRLRVLEYRDQLGRVIPREELPIERAARGHAATDIVEIWHRERGQVGWFRYTITPTFQNGQIRNYVAVISDVTQEMRTERLKSEFLSALAHELKTPVTIVKGYTQILMAEPRMPAPLVASLTAMDRASARTERLIDDAIEISALTLGRLSLTRAPVELRGLVVSMIERVAAGAPHHRIRLSAPTPTEINLDRARIEQVIRRLLDNAVRFSPGGGDIDVELVVEPTHAIVSVCDRGVGIPADKHRHVFELFFRGHAGTAHDLGGLGIGLYLARKIIELHDGEIWFDSHQDHGCTFAFKLPREVRS